MDYNEQLKLQAWLDGELPAAEASRLAKAAAQDRASAALLEALRQTRAALAGFEADLRLPESREFFWSKVAREIARQPTPAPEPVSVPLFGFWRRWLLPAGALAAVFITVIMLTQPMTPTSRMAAASTETDLSEAGALTYRDDSAGTTLVWLTYPADNEAGQDNEAGTLN